MNTTTKKTGVSFNRLSNQPYLKPRKDDAKPFAIGNKTATTAAQAMTLIGYGEDNGLPVRSLDFNVKCEDYKDLAACIKIIDSYNDFDADNILKSAFWALNLRYFLNEDNPNNGGSLFTFNIARESSPAFYVSWNGKYNSRIIKDIEEVEATTDKPAHTLIYWEEYTEQDFRDSMEKLGKAMLADEIDIKITYTYASGENSLQARFWFD